MFLDQRKQRLRWLRPSPTYILLVVLCLAGANDRGVFGFTSPRCHNRHLPHLSSQATDEAGSYDPQSSYVTEADIASQANDLLSNTDKNVIDLPDEVSNSFMQYALSIILGRALPDARDGMKPVHRRILYAMNGLGMGPNTSYRKCARVVGEVLGK